MTYTVKEIFFTLQGEGMNTGRPAVFCRFSGCNLWNGRESHRMRAICRFCDTDFVGVDGVGGGKFAGPQALADAIATAWPRELGAEPFTVLTGGEPLLQVDEPLIDCLHEDGFTIAVETNGTLRAPRGLDWICVSPKARARLHLRSGDELKLVYPQQALEPHQLEHLDFTHFLIQPMDGPELIKNTELAARYCQANPTWQLSLQIHKLLGIP